MYGDFIDNTIHGFLLYLPNQTNYSCPNLIFIFLAHFYLPQKYISIYKIKYPYIPILRS